ncbi:hypothetical protein Sru01_22930 [Sphaerisporangium rufum]|uniref:Uncharacterized protein n=1 Tax=Sphaerisporangium rufum TaxID=1381558 RepID=A0A919R2P8_9ACTN|nr:hypothetical protein Sru01_22930 [Sphaerisporangium rufum]
MPVWYGESTGRPRAPARERRSRPGRGGVAGYGGHATVPERERRGRRRAGGARARRGHGIGCADILYSDRKAALSI